MVDADADRREAEARARDASGRGRGAAVLDQSVRWVRLVPEVLAGAELQGVEQRLVGDGGRG